MYAKEITYTDYVGIERKEKFLFMLTKNEVIELEMACDESITERLQRIIDSKSQPQIMAEFKKLILLSYGIRSADGRVFDKSEEISRVFSHSAAFEELYMELCTDAKAAADFVNGILPKPEELEKYNKDKVVPMVPVHN